MTRDELRAIGVARFGPGWRAPMARALGVSWATIYRYLEGYRIPDERAAKIRALQPESSAYPEEWIIGNGEGGERQYIVHTRLPRFIVEITDEYPHLINVAWIDAAPPADIKADLMDRACAVLECEEAAQD